MIRAFSAALALLAAAATSAAPYADPDAPDAQAAAEAAVARLGAARARTIDATLPRNVVATVRNIAALQGGVGSSPRKLEASVQDLASAVSALKGEESDLEVRIELPADVLFDVDKSEIRADAAQALAHLATVIRGYQGPVRLIGHTDSDGSDAHNLALSQRRAESVRNWLVERESIDAARIATEGLGETAPRGANDTPANKQLNRRVEVIVRKRAG
ncbi:MAG TPA: OmpA family protein [Candidatus Saccharimonadia bacterium]|nr:OmpA family protein [Candidatus Saccharimonadia bacterium]